MSNSLFDQLKKAGLVNEKKAKQIKSEKYKNQKQQRQQKQAPIDEAKLLAQQAMAADAERDRGLNRQRQEEAERKAIAAQIKQLIETSRIKETDGEIAYNFSHDMRVKRVLVTPEVHKQLTNGWLAIVALGDLFEIVPKAAADKIAQRDPDCVIVANNPDSRNDDDGEDDPYADYKVPDDLMW